MPLAKFKDTANRNDLTASITLDLVDGEQRVLHRGGDAVEITDAELHYLQARYVIEVEEDEEPASATTPPALPPASPPSPSAPATLTASSASASGASAATTPAGQSG